MESMNGAKMVLEGMLFGAAWSVLWIVLGGGIVGLIETFQSSRKSEGAEEADGRE